MKVIGYLAAMFALTHASSALAHGGVEHVMGTVKAIASTNLIVEVKDKPEVKVLLDEKTKYEKDGAPATAKDVTVGTRVVVDTKKKDGSGEPVAVLVKLGAANHHAEHARTAGQTVTIAVTEQGFAPERIKVKKGEPVTLVITRKTDKTCATAINIPDYGIKHDLPLNQAVTLTFTPKSAGEIKYVCGMGMPGGVIVVE